MKIKNAGCKNIDKCENPYSDLYIYFYFLKSLFLCRIFCLIYRILLIAENLWSDKLKISAQNYQRPNSNISFTVHCVHVPLVVKRLRKHINQYDFHKIKMDTYQNARKTIHIWKIENNFQVNILCSPSQKKLPYVWETNYVKQSLKVKRHGVGRNLFLVISF